MSNTGLFGGTFYRIKNFAGVNANYRLFDKLQILFVCPLFFSELFKDFFCFRRMFVSCRTIAAFRQIIFRLKFGDIVSLFFIKLFDGAKFQYSFVEGVPAVFRNGFTYYGCKTFATFMLIQSLSDIVGFPNISFAVDATEKHINAAGFPRFVHSLHPGDFSQNFFCRLARIFCRSDWSANYQMRCAVLKCRCRCGNSLLVVYVGSRRSYARRHD